MRIVFMGTGGIALPSLRWLLQERAAHELVGVYTQPDKKIGRKQILTAPEVKRISESEGIPVRQPESFRGSEEAIRDLEALQPDLIIVMAYGQILPRAVIDAPSIACINLHASLLPRHRGASPIQAAIREGDSETGITLMHVVDQLDAGDMILKKAIPIHDTDTGGSLHDRLADLGPTVLEEGLPLLASANAPQQPQDAELVTYAGKLEREHGRLDWQQSAEQLEKLIRAYDPWPGTFTECETQGQRKKLKIFPQSKVEPDSDTAPGTVIGNDEGLTVSCGKGSLLLHGDLQLEGKKRLAAEEFTRGVQVPVGTILGTA